MKFSAFDRMWLSETTYYGATYTVPAAKLQKSLHYVH